MEQQHEINSQSQRKSFFNFVLRRYFQKKGQKGMSKYKIKDLNRALDTQNRKQFWLFLTHDMPHYILSEKMINYENYFKELNYLLSCTGQQNFNGQGYLTGCFKVQKKKLERHYLELIGKQLYRLPLFQELIGIKRFGKQYYVKLIKHIMQKSNNTDEQAKQILMDYIDSNEIRNKREKKEYVKGVIRQLTIQ